MKRIWAGMIVMGVVCGLPGAPGNPGAGAVWAVDLLVGLDVGSDETFTQFVDVATENTRVGVSGKGRLVQLSGTHSASSQLRMGEWATGEGIYEQRGGIITTGGSVTIGVRGSADFVQSGGRFMAARGQQSPEFVLGSQTGSFGSYSIAGDAELVVVGPASCCGGTTTVTVGQSGRGEFLQTGGTVRLDREFGFTSGSPATRVIVGEHSTGSGLYDLSGGLLEIGARGGATTLIVGYGGLGNLRQSGGIAQVMSRIPTSGATVHVGFNNNAVGTYDMAGGTLSIINTSSESNAVADLYLGFNAGSTGTFNLTGGEVHVGRDVSVAGRGSGFFNQSGGMHEVGRDLLLGGLAGPGVYTFTGGTLNVGRNIVVASGASYFFTDIADDGGQTGGGGGGRSLTALEGIFVRGSFFNGSLAFEDYNLTFSTVTLDGNRPANSPQIINHAWINERGAEPEGLLDNFAFGTLVLGDGLGEADNHVRLDSDVYTYGLQLLGDAVLDLNGHTLYYLRDGAEFNGVMGTGFLGLGSWLNGDIIEINGMMASTPLGDLNNDGVLDAFDVAPFEMALADRPAYLAAYPGVDPDLVGDINGDGALDAFDVAAFEALLAGAPGSVPEPGVGALMGVGLLALVRRRG